MTPLELVTTPKEFPTVKDMTAWVVAAIQDRPHGAVISYAELSQILTVDAQTPRGRRAVLNAGRRMLKDRQRLLDNVKNVGYQILKPNEHVGKAERYRKASRRRMVWATDAVLYVDISKLSKPERDTLLTQQVRYRLILALGDRITKRKELPGLKQLALPSGKDLIGFMTKRSEAR